MSSQLPVFFQNLSLKAPRTPLFASTQKYAGGMLFCLFAAFIFFFFFFCLLVAVTSSCAPMTIEGLSDY